MERVLSISPNFVLSCTINYPAARGRISPGECKRPCFTEPSISYRSLVAPARRMGRPTASHGDGLDTTMQQPKFCIVPQTSYVYEAATASMQNRRRVVGRWVRALQGTGGSSLIAIVYFEGGASEDSG